MDIRIKLHQDLKHSKIYANIEDADNENKPLKVALIISKFGYLTDKEVMCTSSGQELVWEDTPVTGMVHGVTVIADYNGIQQDFDNKLIHL